MGRTVGGLVYGKSSQRYTRWSYHQNGRTCDGMGHGLISKGSDVDVVVDGGEDRDIIRF